MDKRCCCDEEKKDEEIWSVLMFSMNKWKHLSVIEKEME